MGWSCLLQLSERVLLEWIYTHSTCSAIKSYVTLEYKPTGHNDILGMGMGLLGDFRDGNRADNPWKCVKPYYMQAFKLTPQYHRGTYGGEGNEEDTRGNKCDSFRKCNSSLLAAARSKIELVRVEGSGRTTKFIRDEN